MIFAAIESIRKDAGHANYNAGLLAGALTKAARAFAGDPSVREDVLVLLGLGRRGLRVGFQIILIGLAVLGQEAHGPGCTMPVSTARTT